MSSTGRGAERSPADFYATPSWCVLRLLEHVELPKGKWLEPSAGEGHIMRALHSVHPTRRIDAIELRPEYRGLLVGEAVFLHIGDFLQGTRTHPRLYGLVIGNPPFSLAQEFVEHGLKFGEEVIYLLRLSFLESQKRQAFFNRVGVPDVFVLPERPSFTGEGTDSCAYAWMRWRRDRSQQGQVRILYDTRQMSLLGDGA